MSDRSKLASVRAEAAVNAMKPSIDLTLVSDGRGVTESGKVVPAGSRVDYIAHHGCGAVEVRLQDGSIEIMHPRCFPALRS